MTISEKIFEILKLKGISQREFSALTDIGQSTISDWKRKGTNPSADKILPICKALGITPDELLSGREHYSLKDREQDYYVINKDSEIGKLIGTYEKLNPDGRNKVQGYIQAIADMK